MHILDLPEEVLEYIFGFCEPVDVARCAQVCTLFHECSTSEQLWEHFCQSLQIHHAKEPSESWHYCFVQSSKGQLVYELLGGEPILQHPVKQACCGWNCTMFLFPNGEVHFMQGKYDGRKRRILGLPKIRKIR